MNASIAVFSFWMDKRHSSRQASTSTSAVPFARATRISDGSAASSQHAVVTWS